MARSNYRTFFLFIAFTIAAAVLWFLFRYNNTYEEYTAITIEWQDVPVDIELEDAARNVEVPIKIKATGFQLLWLRYSGMSMPIDFNKAVKKRKGALVFEPELVRKEIDRSLDSGIDLLEIDATTLTLGYQKFASKSVPVIKDFKLSFEGNFKELGTSSFNVNEVKITGNDELIKDIESINATADQVLVNDSLIKKEIDLASLYPKLRIDPSTVVYTINAAQMTEGNFRIPIVVKNKSENSTVKLIPDVVNVVFSSKLLNYESIVKSDFTVTIDMDKVNNGETTVTPHLNFSNPSINEARIQPQSVQILIIQ